MPGVIEPLSMFALLHTYGHFCYDLVVLLVYLRGDKGTPMLLVHHSVVLRPKSILSMKVGEKFQFLLLL